MWESRSRICLLLWCFLERLTCIIRKDASYHFLIFDFWNSMLLWEVLVVHFYNLISLLFHPFHKEAVLFIVEDSLIDDVLLDFLNRFLVVFDNWGCDVLLNVLQAFVEIKVPGVLVNDIIISIQILERAHFLRHLHFVEYDIFRVTQVLKTLKLNWYSFDFSFK